MKLGHSLYTYILISNFPRVAHVSFIQNESYPQSPEKTKNNGEHEKKDNINT